MKRLFFAALLGLASCSADKDVSQPDPGTATYRVTFEATWSGTTHPQAYPNGAHFSPLIGLSHTPDARLFVVGTTAGVGIKDMAERGDNRALRAEIQSMQRAGAALDLLDGRAATASPGQLVDTITVDGRHPLVSVVAMIAPSPDWFVALENQSLLAENGAWQPALTIPASSYDAGTDSGPAFTAPDQATTPAESIAPISKAPLAPAGTGTPLGTFRLERIK